MTSISYRWYRGNEDINGIEFKEGDIARGTNMKKCSACRKEFKDGEGYASTLCSFRCGLEFWQPY